MNTWDLQNIEKELKKAFKENSETQLLAILKNNSFLPEILILGTFNPKLSSNKADFFYVINFFWTAFKNIFTENRIVYHNERLQSCPYDPSLSEILDLCKTLKLSFSDLILSVFDYNDNVVQDSKRGKEYLIYNNVEYNPISDKDLEKIASIKKVNWNTDNIIDYLRLNPNIKKIYFTRNANNCWLTQLKKISASFPNLQIIKNLYTISTRRSLASTNRNI